MLIAKQLFDKGIIRIRNIDSIFIHLTQELKFNSSDVSDILRSEIVYVVSSFDRFIHDIVKAGMIETYRGKRIPTTAYNNFPISLQQLNAISNASTIPTPEHILAQSITEKHKHLSFQDPNKISEALSLIWQENHKWQRIAMEFNRNQNDIKIELKNIIIRRNQIVHEGDFDLSTKELQPINHSDTIQIVDFIEQLGTTIFNLVN